MPTETKNVYVFGATRTDGDAKMKNLLGGKGANLAEMCRLGIAVPSGFTISTEACTVYSEQGKDAVFKLIEADVRQGVAFVEQEMGKKFGDASDPLLLSVRSGSRASMPGMMDTILNLGLNDEAVLGLARKAKNERFAWDSYRRFVQMYGDVVMGLKPVSKEDHDPFEVVIDMVKEKKGVQLDTDLDTEDLKELVLRFKGLIRARVGREFPTDPWEQLWGAVMAVFQSWNNDRAKVYRELNDIPDSWGTAVNVQAMVFGNLGDNSGTGVAFTRDASTGEDLFNGEFLINAQGEDVVAGIRTPQQVTLEGSRRWAQLALVNEEERRSKFPSLEELMPDIYQQLLQAEHHRAQEGVRFGIGEEHTAVAGQRQALPGDVPGELQSLLMDLSLRVARHLGEHEEHGQPEVVQPAYEGILVRLEAPIAPPDRVPSGVDLLGELAADAFDAAKILDRGLAQAEQRVARHHRADARMREELEQQTVNHPQP